MNPVRKKGFVILLVISFLAILIIVTAVIVNLGCGEILQVRSRNDSLAAYYAATSGAEMMYANLKSKEGQTVSWPQYISGTLQTRNTGGLTLGNFTASANTVAEGIFGIVSEASVNGRTARVTVKYGFNSAYTNGVPLASVGPMELYGRGTGSWRSWVRAEGPLESNSTITINKYVQVNPRDAISGNLDPPFVPPHFWWQYNPSTSTWTEKTTLSLAGGTRTGDVNGDGDFIKDENGDGRVTIEDAGGNEAKKEIFTKDNTYLSDGEINDKDAFYTYYTHELNTEKMLSIGPGETNHYTGDQTFGPGSVPPGESIIFVDGDVNILFNDQNWSDGARDHTIISIQDITIVQPSNGGDDRLTLVAFGDVNTGGVRAFGGVRGDIVVFANGDFNAYYGGRTNGTIFANGSIYVDTTLPIPGLLNRDFNRGTGDWSDPANWPLGLPRGFRMVSLSFAIKNETKPPPDGYVPRWQRD